MTIYFFFPMGTIFSRDAFINFSSRETQQTHDVSSTLFQRPNDVLTLEQRCFNVQMTFQAFCWEGGSHRGYDTGGVFTFHEDHIYNRVFLGMFIFFQNIAHTEVIYRLVENRSPFFPLFQDTHILFVLEMFYDYYVSCFQILAI